MLRQAPAVCARLLANHAARQAAGAAAHAAGAIAVAASRSGVDARGVAALPPAQMTLAPMTRGFAAAAAAAPTIFDKLGGKAAVTAAVDKFYQKVLADPTVSPFFENVSMAAQRKKQVAFLTYALGGPEAYKGKDMFEAHKNMDLKENHFNAIAGHLIATLTELGVKQQYIDEAIAVVATTKDAILKQGEYAGRK